MTSQDVAHITTLLLHSYGLQEPSARCAQQCNTGLPSDTSIVALCCYVGTMPRSFCILHVQYRLANREEPMTFPAKVSSQDLLLATTLSLKYSTNGLLVSRPGVREAFKNFQIWISVSHPLSSCRNGAKRILNDLDSFWPIDLHHGDESQGMFGAVEHMTPQQNKWAEEVRKHEKHSVADRLATHYPQCIISKGFVGERDEESPHFEYCEDYTCGLWQMFHAMTLHSSLHAYDARSGLAELRVLRNWIDHFFLCDSCRTHFLAHADEAINSRSITSERTFILFLWETHNKVNIRVHTEDMRALQKQQFAGTTMHGASSNISRNILDAKLQTLFPSENLCKSCWNHNSLLLIREQNSVGSLTRDAAKDDLSQITPQLFNEENVLAFLEDYYLVQIEGLSRVDSAGSPFQGRVIFTDHAGSQSTLPQTATFVYSAFVLGALLLLLLLYRRATRRSSRSSLTVCSSSQCASCIFSPHTFTSLRSFKSASLIV